MRLSFLLILIVGIIQGISSQTLPRDLESTWKVQEENDRVIEITYELERVDDNRYYKIIVRGFVDDRPIAMSSIGGDVGPSVHVGKIKTILWQWERDVTEISGELKFVVTQDYTADAITTPATSDTKEKPASLPMFGHPGIYLGIPAGVGLAVTGLLSSASAKSDWDDETNRTSETYDPLNKKYKNGQLLSIAGGVVAIGGIVWYLLENSQYKKLSSDAIMKLEPGFVTNDLYPGNYSSTTQVGVKFTYSF